MHLRLGSLWLWVESYALSDVQMEVSPEVSLMSAGSCGAFVHGLEDEFMGESHSLWRGAGWMRSLRTHSGEDVWVWLSQGFP